jgi:integrase
MASIRKRNGKWQVRINRDDISVTKTFLNKKDGETWARLTEVAIERNEFTLKTKKTPETLGQLFDQYNDEVAPLHRSKTTSFMLASLKSRLGDVRVDSFNARDLADWRDKRLQEVKAASVVRELNTLSALLNNSRKEWCIQIANPVADIKRPTVAASRTRRLIDDEESRIVKELPPMFSNIVRFALATSMRRGEVLTLLWANVNLDMQVAVLPMTKNGETRRVPLSKDAVAILKEQRLAILFKTSLLVITVLASFSVIALGRSLVMKLKLRSFRCLINSFAGIEVGVSLMTLISKSILFLWR